MNEPVDHILRPALPWREDAEITECGCDTSKVKTITREDFFHRIKDLGEQRTAMLTCMTCFNTAQRWPTWEDDPRRALDREIMWESGPHGGVRDRRGARLRDELTAIADLIAEHRDEFDHLLEVKRGQREWAEKKKDMVPGH